MQKNIVVMGWIIALLALACSAFLFQQVVLLKNERDTLLAEQKALLEQGTAAKEQLAQLVRAQFVLEEKLDAALSGNATTAEVQGDARVEDDLDLDMLFGGMIEDMAVDAEGVVADSDMDGAAARREDWQDRRGSMQDRFMEMRYGGLAQELGLSPERAEALQTVLASHQRELYDLRRQEREGLISEEEAARLRGEIEAGMNRELASVLNPHELAQLQHYEATVPERMMARSLDRQLSEHSGMPRHLREQLVSTFQNELIHEPHSPDGVAIDPFTRSNEAYLRTLEQLNRTLTAEEYAQAQMFFEERLRMQSAMVERMSTWGMGRGDGRRGGSSGRSRF